jgi:hypothetical protein
MVSINDWHYTTGLCYDAIITDGIILPATAYVPEKEKPIVWFSTNADWDPTANKMRATDDGRLTTLTREETAHAGGGLFRFGGAPKTAPYDWRALKELSGMSARTARGLYRTAVDSGASPYDWRGTFDPVLREKWLVVERFSQGVWVSLLVRM